MNFEYPKRIRFMCARCAMCCGDTKERVRLILLLKIEAEQISQKTSKGIEEFAEKVESSEPYVYKIKKTVDGKCVFLKDNLCSIYHTRPLICKFYPFQLKKDRNNRPIFTYTNECPGIGKGPQLKRSFFQKLFKEFAKVIAKDERKISSDNRFT